MGFGLFSKDILGIYNSPTLYRFRMSAAILGITSMDNKDVEIHYLIYSSTTIPESSVIHGMQISEDWLKGNNFHKFERGGWIVVPIDNQKLPDNRSEKIYTDALPKLQQIWLSQNLKWQYMDMVAYYQDQKMNRRVPIIDLILKNFD